MIIIQKHLKVYGDITEIILQHFLYDTITNSESFKFKVRITGKTKKTGKTSTNVEVAVTLSTQDNAKLLQQLKSGFKITINWNKYQPKVTIERQN